MTADDIIARANRVFSSIARPSHFTNYTHCCECREHDDILLAYTPDTIPRTALGTMAWDPITFTSDEGFRYYLPALIRIVLTETGDNNYYEQFMWHTLGTGRDDSRYNACSEEEREVVTLTLKFLLEHRCDDIEAECVSDDLLSAIELWSGNGK